MKLFRRWKRENIIVEILIFFLLVYTISLFINAAWISEDAYITFRTVDNFAHGYGLRWNVTERVQSYTNPLWMFIILFFYLITNEIYFTVILISLVTSFSAVLFIIRKLSISPYAGF